MQSYRIVFMGTPDFSVPTLEALHDGGHALVAVVTNPDRPKGRGRRVIASPVKMTAEKLSLPILQPRSVKDQPFCDTLSALKPDLLVVVAYGQILSRSVLDVPRIGAVNIHASLLPKYRGPAPIQWAVINGESETGVTAMWMDEGMDTGDILLKSTIPIGKEDTAQTVHDRLAGKGAALLMATLKDLGSGHLTAIPQDHTKATYAPLLRKKDGLIDWTKSARALDCFIRGMYPWPGAYTFLDGRRFKILKAEAVKKLVDEQPGTILEGFPGDLDVATGNGILRLKEVHLESCKCLPVREFLKGCQIRPGTLFG